MDGATIAVGLLQSIKRGYEASHNRGIVGEEGGYWDIHWILASFFGFWPIQNEEPELGFKE